MATSTTKPPENARSRLDRTRELVIFAMLGAIMYLSKILMEWAPNIHFVGMLTVTYTLVFRRKALIPLYLYVFLDGLTHGFAVWWIPYTYIWTILWGVTMLLPKKMRPAVAAPVCMIVCALSGLTFGTLYAPVQALFYGYSLDDTLAWIALGFPYDLLHALGNLAAGTLILPLGTLLCRLARRPTPTWAVRPGGLADSRNHHT